MIFNFPWRKSSKENTLFLSYDAHRNNLGDILSPIIASHFTSKKVIRISKRKCYKVDHYFMLGSILQRCTNKSTILGSGFISEKSICKEKPKKVLAVRGPLTRKKLLEQNIECPEVYGDPALLLPEVYPVKKQVKKYKLGIIPHFLDKNYSGLNKFKNDTSVKIIDVQNKNPLHIVDEMLECDKIASSGLHGLIIADAYKIPTIWIEFTQPIGDDHFKFHDYFASIGRSVGLPFKFEEFNNLNDLLKVFESYTINIDLKNLKNSFSSL